MTLNLVPNDLYFIASGGIKTIVEGITPYLNEYLPDYEITSLDRLMHFFGQATEESARYHTLTEYASGREYEGREDLGNVHSGDGELFKGRGIFQLTGRNNYVHVGEILKVNLVGNPDLAATPKIAVLTACVYWHTHGLNALSDGGVPAIEEITRKVNGGINGLAQRTKDTQKARERLVNIVNVGPATPVLTGPTPPKPPVAAPPSPSFPPVPVVPVPVPPVTHFPIPVTKPVITAVNPDLTYAVSNLETFIKKFF